MLLELLNYQLNSRDVYRLLDTFDFLFFCNLEEQYVHFHHLSHSC